MLYKLGENYNADVEELADLILSGELFPIPVCDMDRHTFLTIYKIGHSVGGGAFLAFTDSVLPSGNWPHTNVRQYHNFLWLNQGQMRDLCTAVIAQEPVVEEDPVELASE